MLKINAKMELKLKAKIDKAEGMKPFNKAGSSAHTHRAASTPGGSDRSLHNSREAAIDRSSRRQPWEPPV